MNIIQKYEFDCRTICDGGRCPYLHPKRNLRGASMVKMFVCRDKHIVLVPEIERQIGIMENIVSIKPVNYCTQMNKLHKTGEAQWADFSIGPDGTGTTWNQEIEIH